jgi:hypothetical protein
MKHLIIVYALLILASCGDDADSNNNVGCSFSNNFDVSDCFSPELGAVEEEQFFFNVQLGNLKNDESGNLAYSIESGSNLVFIYRHIPQNLINVIDDEFEERILFQIDTDFESFMVETESEFEDTNIVYGACGSSFPNVSFQTITGKIEGERVSECEWDVELNLVVQKFNGHRDTIQLKEIFQN